MKRPQGNNRIYRIAFTALMAAIVNLMTFFRFPVLGSKVHLANSMCLLSGLLLGAPLGGLAAGIGSGLYDALWGGYDIAQCLITAVSKFAMAFVCAKVAGGGAVSPKGKRVVGGCILGAFLYLVLYALKTYIYQRYVYGFPIDAVWVTVLSKMPAATINFVVACIITPILYASIQPALKKAGYFEKI